MSGRVSGGHAPRGGGLVLAALLLSGFVVVLLALFAPAYAIIPSVLLVAWVWVSGRADKRAVRKAKPCSIFGAVRKAKPCSICGARYAGADMVEHHIRDHRECSS